MNRRTMSIISDAPERTHHAGALLGAILRAGDLLALHGDLGAGKTQLVRGLCIGLGLDESQVSSPTFVIMNEYTKPRSTAGRIIEANAQPGDTPLIHMDAYRLRGTDDLDSIGWERAVDGESVVAIEWAERIKPALPDDDRLGHAILEHLADEVRRLTLHIPDAWTLREGWLSLRALSDQPTPRSTQSAACPICSKNVPPTTDTWPFCSPRCRLADLDRWMTGQYTLSREIRHDDDGSTT